MKSAAVAAFGLFAGLASASQPLRHMHFPRANTTSVAVDDAAPTTLTVFATSVHTVISCAPTVTNCPARLNATGAGSLPASAITPVVVTDTIVLATTVCPVAEASSISSSLQAAHSSGHITGSTIKGTPPPAAVTPAPNAGVTVSDVVTQKTLTYTIGKGADTSVVTTTIQATTQQTITLTSSLGNGDVAAQPTTTTTATSTGTTTVTVVPEQSGSGSSGSSTGGDVPAGNGEGSCANAPTVTVTVAKETVTVPASTVYVTIAPSSCDSGSTPAVTGQGVENAGNPGSSSGSSSGSEGSGSSGSGSEGSGSDAAATTPSAVLSTPCPTDITTTVRATVTVQPFPVNNGTVPSGVARPSPSGFARLRR